MLTIPCWIRWLRDDQPPKIMSKPLKILFACSDLFFSEPLGIMALSAICKRNGHVTRLVVLRTDNVSEVLDAFDPDVMGYSTMSSDEYLFREADEIVKFWAHRRGKKVWRIMGGAHPTYFPKILDKMGLDAICAGDGDFAIIRMLEAIENGKDLGGIPNVSVPGHMEYEKEVIEDMDGLPWPDRDLMYDAAPQMLKHGIRSFLTQKGCPYKCTYCFNHAYNKMFKGEGRKLLRRRSVDDLLAEIKQVVRDFPAVRMIRFADDVFVIHPDAWLEEFAKRYPKEVGIPFYCLIRANSLTEDIAKLLHQAGCKSISMSIEHGNEEVRNAILKRNMTDELVRRSFALARKYKLNAYANTIMGVPGTTLDDDFKSYLFSKSLKAAAPTFGIFTPYPGTDLTDYAIRIGALRPDYDLDAVTAHHHSVLSHYTSEEKEQQLRLTMLAMLFCKLPDFMDPILKVLIRLPLTRFYSLIGPLFTSFILSTKCFPNAHPRDPASIIRMISQSVKFFAVQRRKSRTVAGNRGISHQTPAMGITSPEY